MFGLRPTSEQPGFDGRRRFVFEVVAEIDPITSARVANPNYLIAIDHVTGSVVRHPSLNLATDKAVEIAGINFGYPAVEEEDPSTNRLVLVYEFVEAALIFDFSKIVSSESQTTPEQLSKISYS